MGPADVGSCGIVGPLTALVQGMEIRPSVRLSDRRSSQRLYIGSQVFLLFKGRQRWAEADAILVDISPNAMRIKSDRKPRLDQTVLFGFLRDGHGLCAAGGMPLRTDTIGGFVVQFTRHNQSFVSFLADLLPLGHRERLAAFRGTQRSQIWIND